MNRLTTSLLTVLIASLSTLHASAETIRVPADLTTIQRALDVARSGDRVVVSAGTYTEQLTISHQDDITLEGRGTVHVRGSHDFGLHILSCSDISVRGLRFTDCAEAGIWIEDCQRVRVENCTIRWAGKEGISVLDSPGTLLEDCKIEDVEDCGIHLGSPRSIARNNRIVRTRTGIAVAAPRCIIEGNEIIDPGHRGILVQEAEAVACLFSGNRIESQVGHLGLYGMSIRAAGCVATDNVISGPGQQGIECKPRAFLLDNTLERCRDYGIIAGGTGTVMAGNRINAAGKLGVSYPLQPGKGHTLIASNAIRGSGEHGIEISSRSNTIARNRISASGDRDVYDTGAQNIYLDNELRTGN